MDKAVVELPKKSYVEELDSVILDALLDVDEIVKNEYPLDSVIQSSLMASYNTMSPEQRTQLLDQLGAEWYLELTTKIEKRLRGLTS